MNLLMALLQMFNPQQGQGPSAEPDYYSSMLPALSGQLQSGIGTVPSNQIGQSDHAQWGATINKYAAQYGINPKFAEAIMTSESNGNPNARNPSGATGLMQLIPSTSKMLGVTDPYDPEQNIHGGIKYLSQLADQFGDDPTLVAAAYNAGPGNVKKHGGVPPFPETQKYVAKINKYLGR